MTLKMLTFRLRLAEGTTKGGDRVEIVSTVHIAQFPSKDKTIADDPKNPKTPQDVKVYDYQWKDSEIVLVDKNFNTLVDPRDKEVIKRFGVDSDNRRLSVVSEVCIQAIGAGDSTILSEPKTPPFTVTNKFLSELVGLRDRA